MTETQPQPGAPALPAGRQLAWVWLTLLAVLLIEGLVAVARPSSPFDRTNFLDYRFNHPPDPTHLLFDAKMRELSASRPTILMVGDSSGFHGIHPPVVEGLLPGARMANMNIFAFGYPGYLAAAEAMLARNPSIKVIVLYITLVALPTPEFTNDSSMMGREITKAFVSPVESAAHLPSLALRRSIADFVYLGTGGTRPSSVASSLRQYPDALRLIPQSGGWVREHDMADDVSRGPLELFRRFAKLGPETPDQEVIRIFGKDFATRPQIFDWGQMRSVDLATKTFDEFRALASKYNVKLVISLAPQGAVYRDSDVGPRIEAFNHFLESYQTQHPGVVVIPFSYWPDERFSSSEHIATPWTIANSIRFGTALRELLGDPTLLKADGPAAANRVRVDSIALDALAPVYGFGPPQMRNGHVVRSLREGRSEGLVYANTHPEIREVLLEPAPDVPDDLLAATSLSVFGEAGERMPDQVLEGRRLLVFRLPAGASRFDGWLELLVSTRGLTTWPGHGLDPDARGPQLALSNIIFR